MTLPLVLDDIPELTEDELLRESPGQTQILTVNNRYARRLLAQFSAALGAERQVMAVPDIVPLGAWLGRQANNRAYCAGLPFPSHTIDAFGAQLLWQEVITRHMNENDPGSYLLDTLQAARLAADADQLIDEWHVAVADVLVTPDYQQFAIWRRAYHRELHRRDSEDRNQMYNQVCLAFEQRSLKPDFTRLVLAGFNELSPRFARILTALQEQGVTLLRLAQTSRPASEPQHIAAADPDTEWRLAVQWASQNLKETPQGRYAIVAARLEADVALAHRYLQPLGSYNIALGRPMDQWPAVRAALAWLHVLAIAGQPGRSCTPADLGAALLAGYCIADHAEAGGRAVIDAKWRHDGSLTLTTERILHALDNHAPRLSAAWSQTLDIVRAGPASADARLWSGVFRQWLQALGFPGDSALDSTAYQQLEALDVLLDKLTDQHVVLDKVSAVDAVRVVRRLARETPFQPRRDPNARLDVLGFLEAEGGYWDGVWVLGLTDDVLPALPRPNPFVPIAALRAAKAPRATPERELQWAQTLYASLLRSAPQVYFSYPQFEGERALRPSPCIAGLAAVDFALQPALPQPFELESCSDDQGPPLREGEKIQGGIAVIDTQARNPLWAFVRYRLGARAMPAYAKSGDTGLRGRFLHAIMESLWQSLESHEGLRHAVAGNRLDALVQVAVSQAAVSCLADYSVRLVELESDRAVVLIKRWLHCELARQPFTVKACEREFHWQRGALGLAFRVDRIDQLDDGRLVVIDYKTGAGAIRLKSDWGRQRPVNLQLPLYASVLSREGDDVAALVMAKLHPRDLVCHGLTDADIGLDTLDEPSSWDVFGQVSWQQVQHQWSLAINNLADEFCDGFAANSTQRDSDLAYCDVLPFLRLAGEPTRDL